MAAAAARSLLAARALPAAAVAAAGGAAPYCTVARQQRRPPPDMRSYLWSRYREAKRVTKGERGRGGPAAGSSDPGGVSTRGVRRLAAGILGVFFAVSLSEERAGPHEEPAGVIQGSGRAVAGPWFQFILPGLSLKRPKTLEAGAGR